MAKFVTGKELIKQVDTIIHEAKKELLVISPYIKLDDYFKKQLFKKHKGNSELHILIAFGKNENNLQKSLTKEDLEYFKDFPNISIVYIPNLHAKYYANENKGIITSINLYDHSFKNNVEFGVVSESKLIGGSSIDKDAWESSMKILKEGYAVFIRRPNYKKKYWIAKDYTGSNNLLDLTENLVKRDKLIKHSVFNFLDKTFIEKTNSHKKISREEFERNKTAKKQTAYPIKEKQPKMLSATNLGKLKNKSFNEVIDIMIAKGFIKDKNTITTLGNHSGLKYKENSRGNKWIVYPEALAESL